MEKNFKAVIEYDGTNYHGFQIQPDVKTIQGEIERILSVLFQSHVTIFGAGRTDAGVHASGQVISFKYDTSRTAYEVHRALNGMLPEDIAVHSVEEVPPDFHARFSAVRRAYKYKILNRSYPSVFLRNISFFYPYDIDVEKMAQACNVFAGTHDFTSFRASSKEKDDDNVRTVFKFDCYRSDDLIITEIEANGFLHMMVRILMGTILLAGRNKFTPEELYRILEAKDRRKAGPTLPPHGLCLVEVKY